MSVHPAFLWEIRRARQLVFSVLHGGSWPEAVPGTARYSETLPGGVGGQPAEPGRKAGKSIGSGLSEIQPVQRRLSEGLGLPLEASVLEVR